MGAMKITQYFRLSFEVATRLFAAFAMIANVGCIIANHRESQSLADPENPYVKVIGEPITPRKNYDLRKELDIYFGCLPCRISAETTVLQNIITRSSKEKFFIWALREDGILVFGEGPDESMSHGVLATLNLSNPLATVGPMRKIYTGGEGYLNSQDNTLFISNKSGHYRPDFMRVNNKEIAKLFGGLVGQNIQLKFEDRTKRPPDTLTPSQPMLDEIY